MDGVSRLTATPTRYFFRGLAFFWVCTILASAISPVNLAVWGLENILVLAGTSWLMLTRRSIPLSRTSYCCCAAFLALHEIGAHFTYLRVPAGYWLQPVFGLVRNDYDRLAHFAFGLLLTLPAYETLRRYLRGPGWLVYSMPVALMMTIGALYEVLEAYLLLLAPGSGVVYLATQGDGFDSQNDMACAMAGSILCMVLVAIVNCRRSSLHSRCA